ncbi:LysR family transcriptional regulator [Pseudonocardia sp. GCM10023141]|uniref:LysR family transcriptional regulator n=1 Tax=Pseudonocardia sp. GCM10023141 TaxID=3252653 RepID=UPI00360F59A6
MLDLNRLRVLQEVALRGSFSAAARSLHITPSAVSQQMAALERSVGVPVVERGARGVTLTDPGRLLSQVVDNLTGDLSHVERHLLGYHDGQTGRLAVATFPTAGQALLPAALAPLTGRPDVELTVSDAETEFAVPQVRAGEVDLALVYHFHTAAPPREWAPDLHYTPLLHEEMIVVVPARHPLAERGTIDLGELADELWIHGRGECAAALDLFFAAAGFRPRVGCRSTDTTFSQTLVAAGVGVTMVPSVAYAPHLDGTARLRIRDAPRRYVGAVHRRDRWRPPLATELLDLLRATVATLTTPGLIPA